MALKAFQGKLKFLLQKGYRVYGLVRRLSTPNTSRISSIINKITLIEGDLADQVSLDTALHTAQPDEIYNLGAQSFVATSWKQPTATTDITGLGAIRIYEAARRVCPQVKLYQASSSEMFGNAKETPQNESTPFHPRSPYGMSKMAGFELTRNYREAYDLFMLSGILFNHELPRRGREFVTGKISSDYVELDYRKYLVIDEKLFRPSEVYSAGRCFKSEGEAELATRSKL